MAALGGCSKDYGVSDQEKLLIESQVHALLETLQSEAANVAP